MGFKKKEAKDMIAAAIAPGGQTNRSFRTGSGSVTSVVALTGGRRAIAAVTDRVSRLSPLRPPLDPRRDTA